MKLRLLLATAITALCGTSLVAASLDRAQVTDALKRGTLGKIPAHLVVTDATFTETSRVDSAVTLKGEAIFAATEDSFVGVRRLGVQRPSGELNATVIRRVHSAGEKFSAPFQAVVSVSDPAPSIAPQLTVSEHGQTRATFKAAVVEGSAEHQKLLALNDAFATADERYQRVKEKWTILQQIRSWLGSYDAFVATDWGVIKQRLIRGLDSRDLGVAYEKQVAPAKKFSSRQAQHAAFIQLVKPVFDPEYARIQAIAEPREAAARAYIDFLEKL